MFRLLPIFGGDPRNISEVVNGIMNGKTNNHGTVTLATGNATTTTIYDERIGYDSKIIVIPWSAAAFTDSTPYGAWKIANKYDLSKLKASLDKGLLKLEVPFANLKEPKRIEIK